VIEGMYVAILVLAGLVAASVFSSLLSFRIGAPLLLVFLGVGMAAGSEGLGLGFQDVHTAYMTGSLALAVVLFDSGFHTPLRIFRHAALPALSLATAGVILTALVVALPAHWLLGLGWTQAMLLGAILASTDAAAVFFLLRVGGITVRERVRSLLEVESGCNDPMAIFLAMALAAMAAGGGHGFGLALLVDLVREFAIAAIGGWAGGLFIVQAVNRLGVERSLQPILVLALALALFSAVTLAGGSGFLAVYVAGLVAGNSRLAAPDTLKRFQDAVSWLAQIAMFLALGLLAKPSEFIAVLPQALAVAVVLMLVARPLAVGISLLPFRISSNETSFVAWVGLRGAVSILLSILPMLEGLEDGRVYFNVAFLVVLVSLSVQGWTIRPVARWLGQIVPRLIGPVERMELEIPGARHELVSYRIVADSLVARGQKLPRWAEPSLVVRDTSSLLFHTAGKLQPGDMVWLFAKPERVPQLDRLFASEATAAEADNHFFGDFPIDPQVRMADFEALYGLPVPAEAREMTAAQFMHGKLGGFPGVGDRVPLGEVELIVRAVSFDDAAITEIGLAAEATRVDAPRLPFVLGGGDLRRRIAALFRSEGG
jgi:cell volume regulation protein A